MELEHFECLVAEAVSRLPQEFQERLENIDVVVEDWPSRQQCDEAGLSRGQTLLGLYYGVPLTRRNRAYGLVVPDKITIFRKTIEQHCKSDDEVIKRVGEVVRHEIAHHFGISDARLAELEKGKD